MTKEKVLPGRGTGGHRLEPLLKPRSIAVVGASGRRHRPGNLILESIDLSGFSGPVYPINPNYPEIRGRRCYGTLEDLPAPVDLAILAGAPERIEAQLRAAITHGARAAYIIATALMENDPEPALLARVSSMAREAGLPLLGPNSIGFVNYSAPFAASWMTMHDMTPGPIAAVVQSGATYGYLNALDPRMRFCLTVHPGQEGVLTVADYMDYALDMPETRVLALYLETVRDPEAFLAALAKACRQDIPVVVIKPGRSEAGAKGILSHAGRLAGSEAGVEAAFRRYGVLRCDTPDEWFATALLMSHGRRPGPGGVAAIMDSGGQRALLMDQAEELGVAWADVGAATKGLLASRLAQGLPAENPVDAWGGDEDWPSVFKDCFQAVLHDPATAIAVYFTDFGAKATDDYLGRSGELCVELAGETEKPVVAATFTSRHFHSEIIMRLDAAGIPVLDGGANAMRALAHAFAYRDWRQMPADMPPPPGDPALLTRWRARLAEAELLQEAEALALLRDFGLPTVESHLAGDLEAALAAAEDLGYPVVLKTAEGLSHKTEGGGVKLGIGDPSELTAAYEDLSTRLGPRVLVARQASGSVEVALGIVRDAQFGPLVMVSAGGTLVELLADAAFALPPVGPGEALRLLEGLKIHRLLQGYRGRPACDLAGLAAAVSRLSQLALELGGQIAELDINPVIVGPDGCLAVDALVKVHNE